MSVTGVSSICFYVADWERSKRFYADGLGLIAGEFSDAAGWAAFSAQSPSPPIFLIRKPELAGKVGSAVVGFNTGDWGGLEERIKAAGGTIEGGVQEGNGVRIHTVRDPDGNVFELSVAV